QAHNCFGCHVQAVTMEALTVGMHHQYDVGMADVDFMAKALDMGVTAGGRVTGAAFQGSAWARYDMWINPSHKQELMQYTDELLSLQQQDGSIPDDDARLPITGGTMETTYQAMQTWRQAFARTADDKWLAPMRKAEQYLARRSSDWKVGTEVYLQDVNFALLGLVAAGVGNGEAGSARLQKMLLSRQNQDGGWGLDAGQSDALATGQTLYALRMAGHGDGESAIDRGTKWLVAHQADDGAWRTYRSNQNGAEKGEGMWAVLGLVSMDVTSLAVNGLVDGQHVAPRMAIAIEARDNQPGGGVQKVELFLDDQPLTGACAGTLAYDWTTKDLTAGKHTIDVIATNNQAKTSRRRFEVYAGPVYLTELGTRFDEARQTTEVAVRNIALEATGKVALNVYATDGDKRGAKVFGTEQAGATGALTFGWNGVGTDGKPQPRGKYIAELAYLDAAGKVVQKTETMFVQDSEASQRQNYAEIEGQLAMDGAAGSGISANTTVELVNAQGEVVQRATSTAQGNYRFKAVAKGAYKVRTKKDGFKSQEATVEAKPAAPAAKADLRLK
ncbi:MAG TPA: carboxypeptidase regulatory-like domain-containing protein, partial [Kofleriaceae bacterium]|nr:carboxypeptidase regulatory-like domain-containing protein [Kofleriaceae bacterium]